MSKNLVYHFNTSAHLEVQNDSNGDWVRVTCLTFRSYAGNRRVNDQIYEGPIFYRDTNFLYEGPLTGFCAQLEEDEDTSNLRKVRKNSRLAYSNEWA